MSSSRRALRGTQSPGKSLVPGSETSDADDALALFSAYAFPPDEWQEDVLDTWLSRKRNGHWAAATNGLAVPRQNGKTGLMGARELYGAVILGEKVLHTAHLTKTATKAFNDMRDWVSGKDISRHVKDIYQALGREAILFRNGGSIEYIARTRSSGRGFTVDILVLDEAQELTDEQMEAVLSTTSAAPSGNPQIFLLGTPPSPAGVGEVFRRVRKEALEDHAKELSWFEWSVDEIGDISDRSRWEATNPALGKRLNVSVIEAELKALSEDGFARERLGWWPTSKTEAVIKEKEWQAVRTDTPPSDGKLAYGIKFAPDGSAVALAVALKMDNGHTHIEVADHKSLTGGTAWLVEWLSARWRKASIIVIDGLNGAAALSGALIDNGVSKKAVMMTGTREVIASSTMLLNAVREKTLTHYGQPALDICAVNAVRRNIGNNGGWGFGGDGDLDVSPLEAVALAHYGVLTSKRDPGRKQRLL